MSKKIRDPREIASLDRAIEGLKGIKLCTPLIEAQRDAVIAALVHLIKIRMMYK
jgi:hypothetical protein